MKIIDDFFMGKIKLLQPGYKATSDAVFLAATLGAGADESILDVGCGNGAIALIAAYMAKSENVVGVDSNEQEIAAAKENARLNRLAAEFIAHDIFLKENPLSGRRFDHVVTNPPFFVGGSLSKSPAKAKAHHQEAGIAEWLGFCLRRVTDHGRISLIIDMPNVPAAITAIDGKCGDITLFPLYPKAGAYAKRAIIRATKASRAPFRLSPGLVLHNRDGSYTEEADNILRHGVVAVGHHAAELL